MRFDLPKYNSNIIKVIGVGGGGSNAVNYMYNLGIENVDFAICNTDSQALYQSEVPNKIQLGPKTTEGLGVGGDPKIGELSAQESVNEIEELFGVNTKIVFITAGMGGGTGTGAAPVIAKKAKEKEILTIGIVTIPFDFEGPVRKKNSKEGIENLRKNVDTLLIVDNNNILKIYGDLPFIKARKKADEILAVSAKGISEIITKPLYINIDLNDVRKVLKNSGRAIFGIGKSMGENRALKAVKEAINSPLLEDNKIINSSDVLLSVISSEEKNCTTKEFDIITDFLRKETNNPELNIFLGAGEDNSLIDDEIIITIVATNFDKKVIPVQKDLIKKESNKTDNKQTKPLKILEFDFNDDLPKTQIINKKDVFFQLDKDKETLEYVFDFDKDKQKNDNCIIFELDEKDDSIKKTIISKSEIENLKK